MKVQFFRLVRKPQAGAGRRYYRLLCYPQDCVECATEEDAHFYAEKYKYAAYKYGNQFVTLNDKARQCLDWHQAGKDGYVNVL